MRADLPAGVVTFVFTDVEGSTRLLHGLGEAAYAELLAEHRRALREAFGRQGGVEVDTQGSSSRSRRPKEPCRQPTKGSGPWTAAPPGSASASTLGRRS